MKIKQKDSESKPALMYDCVNRVNFTGFAARTVIVGLWSWNSVQIVSKM